METLTAVCPNIWKKGRLATFENWPFQGSDCVCTPERMAAAGFIAIGGKTDPDLVECFVCGKELDGWDPDDDPWEEHVQHTPSCLFVNIGKVDETLWTVSEFYSLIKAHYNKLCIRAQVQAVARLKNESEELAKHIPIQKLKKVRKSRKVSN